MKSFIRRYIFSTNHKVIAIQYLIMGLIWLAFGGALAYMIRAQVAHPWQPIPVLGNIFLKDTGGAIMPEQYVQLFTMHGGIMVFFAVTPIVLGAVGNYTLPLEVGAKDMAFPRLNMLSFWFLVIGSILVVLSYFVPGGPAGTAWTLYPPLSGSLKVNPGWGIDLFILALAMDAISILMGGVNYITTIIRCRAKGMKWDRIPLTSWGIVFASVLNTLWLPLAVAALVMVLADRRLDTAFFVAGPLAPRDGGQVLLFQHLFWGFGHPEVYILILPVWGVVCDLLSVFSRKPSFGYKASIFAMATISILSGIVWGHHMYTTGMNPLIGKAFMVLTISVSVPTSILFLNWLGTLWKGAIRFEVPMLFAMGVVFVFAIGGLTGLFFAVQTIDVYVHDTYFVVGHFHYTLAASVLFGIYAFIYFWFPKMFGREMNKALGKIHFVLTFVYVVILFFVMMYVGAHGHLRRLADPTEYDFLKHLQPHNVFMGKVAAGLVLTQFIFAFNFFWSLFLGRKAASNPWEAAGVAWTTSSPPSEHNYHEVPTIYSGPYEYGIETKNRDYRLQTEGQPSEIASISNNWISTAKLGMWAFLMSEIMLFTGFIGSYIVLRLGSVNWPSPSQILNIPLLGLNTFVLICSSLTLALGVDAAKNRKVSEVRKYLLLTALLGLLFIGIKISDYFHMWHEGFTIQSSLFGSCYYLLTGFHALHVLSGVVLLLTLWVGAGKQQYVEEHAERFEASGLYWHFIDIVWVILFGILCLL